MKALLKCVRHRGAALLTEPSTSVSTTIVTNETSRRCFPPVPTLAPACLVAVLSLTATAESPTSHWGQAALANHGPGVVNHPVRVVPSNAVRVPPSWPLDGSTAITCLTCHIEIPSGAERSDPKLRDFDSNAAPMTAFCAKCHDRPDRRSGKSLHWLALAVAHVPHDSLGANGRGGFLDTQTRTCLSCHDGAMASESENPTSWSGSRGSVADPRRNHPVGIPYDNPARPNDRSPLRPSQLLPREVVLPSGQVGCVSCHNLYGGSEHLLTVPIRGSELCLTCHDMS